MLCELLFLTPLPQIYKARLVVALATLLVTAPTELVLELELELVLELELALPRVLLLRLVV